MASHPATDRQTIEVPIVPSTYHNTKSKKLGRSVGEGRSSSVKAPLNDSKTQQTSENNESVENRDSADHKASGPRGAQSENKSRSREHASRSSANASQVSQAGLTQNGPDCIQHAHTNIGRSNNMSRRSRAHGDGVNRELSGQTANWRGPRFSHIPTWDHPDSRAMATALQMSMTDTLMTAPLPPMPVPVQEPAFPLDPTQYYLLGQLEYYFTTQSVS